ncbi:hypothetical protein AC529_00575 [Thermobifida cellulosilytica TB100]|uniref:Uncharacterized protein n=1 Tax=Thermobifida cellulosilytica TB100 TaxID=665004 RepID=A0A147KMM8_THECS|nr:hypothetical protein AC529_00575 [Thermobifida cellulosilytica TB100]
MALESVQDRGVPSAADRASFVPAAALLLVGSRHPRDRRSGESGLRCTGPVGLLAGRQESSDRDRRERRKPRQSRRHRRRRSSENPAAPPWSHRVAPFRSFLAVAEE